MQVEVDQACVVQVAMDFAEGGVSYAFDIRSSAASD
jgi:hypothetical protein